MKYIKKFNEMRMPNLQHVGDDILPKGKISIFQQDWFEKLVPNEIRIVNLGKEYTLDKNDCTINGDLVQFNYYHTTIKNPNDVSKDGEPDLLEFDIHFVRNDRGIKLLVNITYGDNMACEFTIETPNKINVGHYTGIGSIYDPKTHWGFKDETILDLVEFFNRFSHGIKLTPQDLSFIDEHPDSYKHDIDDKKHLYNDDSDLMTFGNSMKENYNSGIIVVINNAKPPQFKYLPKVLKYLDSRGLEYKVANTPQDVIDYNSEYNIIGAISTGSDFSMRSPGSNSEFETNEKALELLNCPIIAMCYGFQSMANYYGEIIDGGELKCDNLLLTDYDKSHFLFNGIDLGSQKVSFCFHDYPIEVPNGFSIISKLDNIITGISNKNLERYGILFHPEELKETYIILDNFINHCKSKIKLDTKSKIIKKFDLF
jgi:anthranilate/para-aminobenzoate synthase component II